MPYNDECPVIIAKDLREESINLFYSEASSNKTYQVQLLHKGDSLFTVEFQYGRVGNALQTGSKVPTPIPYEPAKAIYDKLVREKTSKGYTPKEGGTPYSDTENSGRVSGLVPQLLNFIEEEEVSKYLEDDSWVMQEKKDGVRCMIKKSKKTIEGVNRKGLITCIPKVVEESVRSACGEAEAILDGELVGDVYWIFDILAIGVHSAGALTYQDRLTMIQEWFSDSFTDHFRMTPTSIGKSSKKSLYKRLKQENAEGVVFKLNNSLYKPGRPASGGSALKYKFVASASVRVRCHNDKRSVQVEVLERGDWILVGNVTIPINHQMPKPGTVIEVKYLYAFEGGSLYQPIYLGERNDIDSEACLKSQLKYKQQSQEDE